jgi:hypothetical protein
MPKTPKMMSLDEMFEEAKADAIASANTPEELALAAKRAAEAAARLAAPCPVCGIALGDCECPEPEPEPEPEEDEGGDDDGEID